MDINNSNGKEIRITPKMTNRELDQATAYLLDSNKVCVDCGGVNLMDTNPKCKDCVQKESKCSDCSEQCHADLGGVFAKCKKCLIKDGTFDKDGNSNHPFIFINEHTFGSFKDQV